MTLTGNLLIGAQEAAATAGTMKALNPATNAEIEPPFAFGGATEVDRAARLADDAFDSYNHTSLAERAAFLERIADGLDAIQVELAQRASLETGLPIAQLEGETAKAATQFRQFATVVRQGRFRNATIDPAQPDRQPRPRMDHRMQRLRSAPLRSSARATFRSRTRSRAATPHRRSPPARRSS
jgi:2,5-dioxopentanoate dehydrogenase